MGKHVHTTLAVNSPFIGQICPVSRQDLLPGHEVLICLDSNTPILVESWEYLGGQCPFCGEHAATQQEMPPPAPTERVDGRPSIMAARLVIPGGVSFPLDRQVTNIGRSPENDLVLSDPSVSRQHARIRRHGRAHYFYDLASANGSWLGDRRIYRLLLDDGDRLRLGNVPLVFQQGPDRPEPRRSLSTSDTQPLCLKR